MFLNNLKEIWIKYLLYNKFIINLLDFINKFRFKKIDLILILWPPACDIFDKICEEVKKKYTILNSYDIQIKKNNFDFFLNEIYKLDYGSLNKISNKIIYVGVYPYKLRILKVRFYNPIIITQDILNRKKCKDVNLLKQHIRSLFSSEIKDYKYDMIVHSTETEKQGQKAELIIKNMEHIND